MAKQKCYTTMAIFTPNEEFRKNHGFQSHQRQFSIACIATSYEKANDIAKSIGLGKGVFRRGYTNVLTEDHPLFQSCEELGGFTIETNKKGGCVSIHEALRERKEV